MGENGKSPVPSVRIELPRPGDRVQFTGGRGAIGVVKSFAPHTFVTTVDWGIIDVKIGRIITDHPIEDIEIAERKEEAEKRIAETEARLKAEGKAGQG